MVIPAVLVWNAGRSGIIYAVAMLAVASNSGAADSDPHRTLPELSDLNGDHRISYDEFVHSVAVKAMREMDEDKNGLLTPRKWLPQVSEWRPILLRSSSPKPTATATVG
jgi:hypothetical protein